MSLNPTQDAIKTAETIFKVLDEENKAVDYLRANPTLVKGSDRSVIKTIKDNPAQRAIVDQWKSDGRQLLAIHPDLVREIKDMRTVSVVTEVIAALPYMNPMVLFGEPIVMPSWKEGETMLLHGMFLYGRTAAESHSPAPGPGLLCGTHDGEAQAIGALMFYEVTRGVTTARVGSRVLSTTDWEMNKMSIPLDRPHLDIEELASAISKRYGWDSPVVNPSISEDFMASALRVFLAVILYLCSTTLDVEMTPKSRLRLVKLPGIRKPPSLIKVGWNVGPALTKARAEWAEGGRGTTGRGQGPQHRRCYTATRWTGPGRTIPKTVFVAPYITHRELWDLIDTKTVRPVPRPKEPIGHIDPKAAEAS